MKKGMVCLFICVFVCCLFGCSQKEEPTVVNTFAQTPATRIGEIRQNSEDVIMTTYYELSDGTWKTDQANYQYRLVLTGRLNHAATDITYTILSNLENISFEQAWKASGLSSDLDDYFDIEDADIVAVKLGTGT